MNQGRMATYRSEDILSGLGNDELTCVAKADTEETSEPTICKRFKKPTPWNV
jgi:hypothetical protein